MKKVIEHPTTRLIRQLEAQNKEIQALKIDIVVLRDLLLRTVRMLARAELVNGHVVMPVSKKLNKL